MISRELLHKYLSPRLGELVYTHQGLKADCPVCDSGGKKNLEVNVSKNAFNCWSCHQSGTIRQLLDKYSNDTSWKALPEFRYVPAGEEAVVEKELNYPKETVPFYLDQKTAEYLTVTRGISREELVRRKVSYVYSEGETYHNHVCFPFYEDGRLVGACLQDMRSKRYRNLGKLDFVPYGEFVDPMYPVVITEGVYDALSGTNAIPMLTTQINRKTLAFVAGRKVVLAVDNTVEENQYMSLMKQLEAADVMSLVLFDMKVYKDMNDYYREDRRAFLSELNSCFKK